MITPAILLDVDHESKIIITHDSELLLFEKLDPIRLSGSRLISEADHLATVVRNGTLAVTRGIVHQQEITIL